MTDPAPTPEAPETPAATPEAPKPGSTPEKPAEDSTDWKAEARKWEGRAKTDAEDAKAYREYKESQKTEDEKRAAREKELEQRVFAAETKALRADVADTKKVPAEWRKFLTGGTQEELEASADEILTLIAAKPGTTPDPNQGQPTGTPSGDFLRNAARH